MGKMVMALKKLGKKLTGKTINNDNTVGVINEIADNYEAPDGGGDLDTSITTISDLIHRLEERTGDGFGNFDIDALIAFVNKYNIDDKLKDGYWVYVGYVNMSYSLLTFSIDSGNGYNIDAFGGTQWALGEAGTLVEALENNRDVEQDITYSLPTYPDTPQMSLDAVVTTNIGYQKFSVEDFINLFLPLEE